MVPHRTPSKYLNVQITEVYAVAHLSNTGQHSFLEFEIYWESWFITCQCKLHFDIPYHQHQTNIVRVCRL